MTALEIATKTCTKCGEDKPLSEFHRRTRSRDGHASQCKACALATVRKSEERRRLEMGEAAWRVSRRDAVSRHRERTGNARGRAYSAAQSAALGALRDIHRSQYEALLRKELYERGLL